MYKNKATPYNSLQHQLEALQNEYEHLKYRVGEAEGRANSVTCEVNRLKYEIQTKEEEDMVEIIKKHQSALTSKDAQLTRVTQRNKELKHELAQVHQQLEEVHKLAKCASEGKHKAESLELELVRKSQEIAELSCHLQNTQQQLTEQHEQMHALETKQEEYCRLSGGYKEELEHAKNVNCECEKTVEKLECQLKELSPLKIKCNHLEERLKDKVKEIAEEQDNIAQYKQEKLDLQEKCKDISQELKLKEGMRNILNMQVKRQSCELKAGIDKLSSLQACGSFRRVGKY